MPESSDINQQERDRAENLEVPGVEGKKERTKERKKDRKKRRRKQEKGKRVNITDDTHNETKNAKGRIIISRLSLFLRLFLFFFFYVCPRFRLNRIRNDIFTGAQLRSFDCSQPLSWTTPFPGLYYKYTRIYHGA